MGAVVTFGRIQAGGRRLSSSSSSDRSRIARVLPDVSGIDTEFDYEIPDAMVPRVRTGTIVRADLNNRRIRAWVLDPDASALDGVKLKALTKVTGAGPSAELIDLAEWASWRWFGKRQFFLITASPPRAIHDVLPEMRVSDSGERVSNVSLLRLPPAMSSFDTIVEGVSHGPCMVLAPTNRGAVSIAKRLRELGHRIALYPDDWNIAARGNATVVGTRAAAWATLPHIHKAYVVDAHDANYKDERSPTWNAVDVVVERMRRRGGDVTLISPVPRLDQVQRFGVTLPSAGVERSGWAPLHVIDLRKTDPRSGMYSHQLVELLRSTKRVALVLNRKGRAQLLVCARCDEIAKCSTCGGSLTKRDEELSCSRCKSEQPVICASCGSTTFKQFRPGIAKVREELESLANRSVGEVSAESDSLPATDVLVGTEAVLHRIGRADAVVFMDFDQELLAARYQAPEDALILLARASRIVGGHNRDGVVVVQTRQPDHDVVTAAVKGDPEIFYEQERERRSIMSWPPFTALARVSGKQAEAFVEQLKGIEVLGPLDGAYLLQAPDHEELCNALAAVPRPSGGGLRVEVDPVRV